MPSLSAPSAPPDATDRAAPMPTGQPRGTSGCGLRILSGRPCEPRYDDDPALDATPPTVGALALAFPVRRRHEQADADAPEADWPKRPPTPWIGRLVQVLTEVLSGDRPLVQLSDYLSPGVYGGMERRLGRHPVAREQRRPSSADLVRSVHVHEPRPGALEVAAVIRRGQRMAALALRLEVAGGRWQCTALHVG